MSALIFAYLIVTLSLLIFSRTAYALLQPVLMAWYFVVREVMR